MAMRKMLALAAAAPLVALPMVGAAAPAFAQGSATPSPSATPTQTYTATLAPVPLNGANSAGGTLTLALNGTTATITEDVHGLASTFMGKPFPHVQHIHGLAMGTCPTASADANKDGVISTPEAQPDYGAIQTTLSTTGDTSPAAGTDISIAPSGSSYHYSRTIQLDANTMKAIDANNAVIVVHGIDPATAPKAASTEKSPLVPSLPLAATAPALCGKLVASTSTAPSAPATAPSAPPSASPTTPPPGQVSPVPSGPAQTGGGSTAGVQDVGLFALGGAALAAAGAALGFRRRSKSSR